MFMSFRDYIGCTTSAHLFYINSEFSVVFDWKEHKMWNKVKMANAIKLLGVRVVCD